MRHTPERRTDAADRTVKDIRRKTRKRYSSEDNPLQLDLSVIDKREQTDQID